MPATWQARRCEQFRSSITQVMASLREPGFSNYCQHLRQRQHIKHGLRQQLPRPRVLLLEALQIAGVGCLLAPVLRPPGVGRRFADPVLAAEPRGRRAPPGAPSTRPGRLSALRRNPASTSTDLSPVSMRRTRPQRGSIQGRGSFKTRPRFCIAIEDERGRAPTAVDGDHQSVRAQYRGSIVRK